MNKTVPIVAILVSAVALIAALSGKPGTQSDPPNQATSDKALEEKLNRVESELKQATQTIAELKNQLATLESRPGPSSATRAVDSNLARRIAALEQQSQELTKFTNEFDQYGVVSSLQAELVNAYSTLMDTNQSTWDRLKQVGSLKRYRYFDDKALQAVADIYVETADFGQKGQALAAMKGMVPSPEFRNQILADLSAETQEGNQSARFRYFAIEALEPVRDDPAVREWLAHLAQNDPEAKLANRAGQALSGTTPK